MNSRIKIYDDVDMVSYLEDSVVMSHPRFDLNPGIYLQGVNCQAVMRSGIAARFNQVFPIVSNQYHAFISTHFATINHRNKFIFKTQASPAEIRLNLLGRVNFVTITHNHNVANCFTQFNYGRDPDKVYVDYGAIEACMRQVNNHPLSEKGVHFPLIGAGLGGGDWATIENIILNTMDKHKKLYLYLYSPVKKNSPVF